MLYFYGIFSSPQLLVAKTVKRKEFALFIFICVRVKLTNEIY